MSGGAEGDPLVGKTGHVAPPPSGVDGFDDLFATTRSSRPPASSVPPPLPKRPNAPVETARPSAPADTVAELEIDIATALADAPAEPRRTAPTSVAPLALAPMTARPPAGPAQPPLAAPESEEAAALDVELDDLFDDLPAGSNDGAGEDPFADLGPIASPRREERARPRRVSARPPGDDRGAQAAKRTVRYRKPREELFSLVGTGPETLEARRALLERLVERQSGAIKAGLACAAAEIAARTGATEDSEALYAVAREADPHDLVALRAARRTASGREDWSEVATLLEAEARLPLSPEDRHAAWMLLAEVQLHPLADAERAERSAMTAFALAPSSVATALLLAETKAARGHDTGPTLERAIGAWQDALGRSALLGLLGRQAEHAGQNAAARELYRRANAERPALESLTGHARTSRDAGDLESAAQSIAWAAELLGPGTIGERLRRAAARIAHVGLGRPADAVAMLSEAKQPLSLRARAEAAAAAEDVEARVGSIEGWAAAAGGTERALALVTLAELRAEHGDHAGADEALRNAALADNGFALIRVVREVLARRSGDAGRLATAAMEGESGHSLTAAAKLASRRDASERELDLLSAAQDEQEAPATADVLALDAAAALGDRARVVAGLSREADRASTDLKVGVLLALSEEAAQDGDLDTTRALLAQAREIVPGDARVLRPLGRLLAAESSVDGAAAWLEEAASAPPERAAFAATTAGRLLELDGHDAGMAYRRALDVLPTYLPAVWALEPLARQRGDLETLADLNEQQAEQATNPLTAGGRLVRAALLRASSDRARAAALLERARQLCPDDHVLEELLLRLGDSVDAVERASLLAKGADSASPTLARSALLRAAGAFEDAGDPSQAAALYRQVLVDHPDDAFARSALDRVEIAAGEIERVAERKFAAVREASEPAEKARAFERLATLDLHERNDPGSAMLSFQSILEVEPGHLPSLRTLERYYMDHQRDEDLAGIERHLAHHVAPGDDAAAHLRLAVRLALRGEDTPGDAADRMLVSAAERARPDLWLARHVLAAARAEAKTDVAAWAAVLAASLVRAGAEHAAACVSAADELEDDGRSTEALELLERSVAEQGRHPLLSSVAFAERLGELSTSAGKREQAADAFEEAAKIAHVKSHAAELWYRAGILWTELEQNERAIAALSAAADTDPAHRDVFERLRRFFTERGNTFELIELTKKRIAAGGDPAVIVELDTDLANLQTQAGDREGAKQALRAALSLEPDNVEGLRRLSELCLADHDWRGAAEALIRIARLRKDREELRTVFLTLGNIYDRHMPDARRAEAAYKRVLKLAPSDVGAMERLANLYEREGNPQGSAEMLAALAQHEVDPDRNREHRLRLAASHERQGDARGAEAILEQTRKTFPVDTQVIRTLADFYERQNAQPALHMHLNRAVNDFRHALTTDPADAAAWTGLVEVLAWRGRADAASAIASAAAALGVHVPEIDSRLDAMGGTVSLGAAAAEPDLEEILAPPALTRVIRAVFRMAAEPLDRALPFDPRSLRADRMAGRASPFAGALSHVGPWFGVQEVQVFVTTAAPRVFVPIADSPPSILVGSDIIAETTPIQQAFLLARALKLTQASLSVVVRSQPAALAHMLAGLVRTYDPTYAPHGLDSAHLDEMTKRLAKLVHRRIRDELMPLVIEMAGIHSFDPTRLGLAASELADRTALVCVGSTPAAVDALLCLAGRNRHASSASAKVESVRQVPEAAALFDFAISDAHFEARRRAGGGG